MKLSDLVEAQVNTIRYNHLIKLSNSDLAQQFLEQSQEYRQVCARIDPQVVQRMDRVLAGLEIQKRLFIESAISAACDFAEPKMDDLFSEIASHLEGVPE